MSIVDSIAEKYEKDPSAWYIEQIVDLRKRLNYLETALTKTAAHENKLGNIRVANKLRRILRKAQHV